VARRKTDQITSFDLKPGRKVGQRYVVEANLGKGTEGEVYQIREVDTEIRRAAKIYFPHRDPDHSISIRHAQKLETLRHCPIVLQYHHSEFVTIRRQKTVALISELAEGVQLQKWINRHRGGRLRPYTAMHVLYNLVRGLEAIHALGEYHADVHTENILIQPRGVRFGLKLIDFYDWGRPAKYKQQQDLYDTVRVFLDCLGGRSQYARQPPEVKHIVSGLRRDLVLKRFPTMTALRRHLESFEWQTMV
jgi:tRNA A-37 threonylcarbamoyl transferase component Bud32